MANDTPFAWNVYGMWFNTILEQDFDFLLPIWCFIEYSVQRRGPAFWQSREEYNTESNKTWNFFIIFFFPSQSSFLPRDDSNVVECHSMYTVICIGSDSLPS